MSDFIKREDAIKAMAKAVGRILYDAEEISRHVMNSIPSAENKGEWIPCSERLPNEFSDDKRVLVTTDVDELGVILMPVYDVKSWYLKGYISAWMPAPKPWEGADDE